MAKFKSSRACVNQPNSGMTGVAQHPPREEHHRLPASNRRLGEDLWDHASAAKNKDVQNPPTSAPSTTNGPVHLHRSFLRLASASATPFALAAPGRAPWWCRLPVELCQTVRWWRLWRQPLCTCAAALVSPFVHAVSLSCRGWQQFDVKGWFCVLRGPIREWPVAHRPSLVGLELGWPDAQHLVSKAGCTGTGRVGSWHRGDAQGTDRSSSLPTASTGTHF